MKSISAGAKVGVLFLLMIGGTYAVWQSLGSDVAGGDAYPLSARFRDASGLPLGTKVVVAGLPVGTISSLSIDGRYAIVTFRVRGDVQVWSSAIVIKKARSLLGDNYLEVDPGAASTVTPDGSTETHTLLKSGDQVPRVIESTSPDALMHRIEATLPNVDAVLLSVKDLSDDVRRIVNGPLASVATRVDGLIQRESGTVSDILERANRSMGRIEQITSDIRALTKGADGRVTSILANLDAASAEAKTLVETARKELADTGSAVRAKLDHLDGVIASSESITRKIDEDQGTLGRLVNDPAIADNVEDITEDAKGFLGTLFGLKTYVGLRSEYNVFSGLLRNYVAVELHSRPDKYYLIELETGPRGDYPSVSLTYDPTVDANSYVRKVTIDDSFRFTFQFAKRFSWLTLRYGLKESTGGVGVDADLPWLANALPFGSGDLRLSADVFDASFDRYPRVKVAAALRLFHHLYILGGVDEILNTPAYLDIRTGGAAVPEQFSELRYGRDYFFGGMLRFSDEDLSALLTVGGSALSGATGGSK
ncbi:MAG: MCE family protein [Myxococcales bacterium]|nr:MCE family protein [Myxococcales bacterium]